MGGRKNLLKESQSHMTLGLGGLILAVKTGRPHLPHRPLRVRPGSHGGKELGAGAGRGTPVAVKGQVRCQLSAA